MMTGIRPTPTELHEMLEYSPETGKLFWRKRGVSHFSDGKHHSAEHVCKCWNARRALKEAFTLTCGKGYKQTTLLKKKYAAHRVIWAMVTGEWPEKEIDHINHNRADNRWTNLREATREDNAKNLSLFSNNTSGVAGVGWCASTRKWRVAIGHNKIRHYLGRFEKFDEAIQVRKAAERKFGFHASHGKPPKIRSQS